MKWILILIVFFAANGVNYLVNSNIRSFIAPSKMIIHDFNSLMRGENKFIEGYVQLKAQYYLNSSNMNASFFDQVQRHLE